MIFGPAFSSELQAAGLLGLPISWGANSVTYGELTAAQRDALDAVIAAHDPAKPAPPIVPSDVPMWAAQAALKQAGKYDAINAFILTLENANPPVFFAWTMGNFASRHSAFIAALAAQFGMTDPDIDGVFIAADKIAAVAG